MIYFIQCGEFVKIGRCERDPIRRLEKLQIGNPVTLRLIAVIPEGGRMEESNWHNRFDSWRVRGEWFKLGRKIKAAIKPHLVDHDEFSRQRPERTINGMPAHLLYAALNSGAMEAAYD